MGDKFPSPPFRAILSFSRCAHWLSCCAHGGFFVRLGVGEWERWKYMDRAMMCGAMASALLHEIARSKAPATAPEGSAPAPMQPASAAPTTTPKRTRKPAAKRTTRKRANATA